MSPAAHARLGVHTLGEEHDDAGVLDVEVSPQGRDAVLDAGSDLCLQRSRQQPCGVEKGDLDGHEMGSGLSISAGPPNMSSIERSSPGGSRRSGPP